MRMRLRSVFVFLSLLVLASCTKMCGNSRSDLTPEQVVEAYLDVSLNMNTVEQKEHLLDLTTGNLHSAIASASDDDVSQAFIKKHYKLNSYSVIERRDRTPRETEITFQLVYRNLGEDPKAKEDSAPLITTDNTVSVVKEDGAWLIRDVIGKKTSIDFPVVEGEVIKPGSEGESESESESESTPPQ